MESMNMNPRISMITLGVRDLAGSVKFYEQGLGFPRIEGIDFSKTMVAVAQRIGGKS